MITVSKARSLAPIRAKVVSQLILLSLVFAARPMALEAQTNQAKANPAPTNSPAPSNNRYLLIMETSRAMERRSQGALQAVQNLLLSTMGGQLRRGDDIAIWTYNNELHGGQFPLQKWYPELHQRIMLRMLSFLESQKYEKQADLTRVMPSLDQLIKSSGFLTVILVSDGEQLIHDTSFDDQINQMFNTWRQDQEKARMPFLTILRSRNGKLTDFSVNPAQWPVELPPLPKDLLVVQPEKKPETNAPPPKPRPMAPPLIISGRKTATNNSPAIDAPTNVITAPQLVPDKTAVVIPATNVPPALAPSEPAKPAAPQLPATGSPSQPSAGTALPISAPVTKPDQLVSAPQPGPASTVERATLGTNAPAPNTENKTETRPDAGTAGSEPARIGQGEPAQASGTKRAATRTDQAVGIVPPVSSSTRLLLFGGGAAAIVVVLAFIWLRRSRSARHVSLITRSLDQRRP